MVQTLSLGKATRETAGMIATGRSRAFSVDAAMRFRKHGRLNAVTSFSGSGQQLGPIMNPGVVGSISSFQFLNE